MSLKLSRIVSAVKRFDLVDIGLRLNKTQSHTVTVKSLKTHFIAEADSYIRFRSSDATAVALHRSLEFLYTTKLYVCNNQKADEDYSERQDVLPQIPLSLVRYALLRQILRTRLDSSDGRQQLL